MGFSLLRRFRRRTSPRPDSGLRKEVRRMADSEAQRLAHVGSWEWDALTNEVSWSEELYRIYAVDKDEFDGTYEGFLARVYEPDRELTRQVVARALRDGLPFDYDHRIVRPGGELRMLMTRGGTVRAENGGVVRLVGCCLDVTEAWLTRKRLAESLSVLGATLDATFDGIFVLDLTGRVIVCSRRAKELWNIPDAMAARGELEELIAHVRDQLADPEGFVESERKLSENMAYEGMDLIRFKDGRVFERFTRPQRLGEKVVGRVCSFRDVTVRERALAELRGLNASLDQTVHERTRDLEKRSEELKRSNAELELFAAAASHDLSAPTRKIIAFSQLLDKRARDKLSPDECSMLARIRRCAEDMAKLTADVLMLSRVSRESLPIEDVPLDAVMAAVISDLEVTLAQAGGVVEYGALPVARGHVTLYRRLLENLVANGLKFRAPDRPPRVKVTAKTLPDGGAELRVEDNGIGFEPRFARDIFLPFRRLNPTSQYEGHGIGLAACERIAQRYGGTIRAEGAPGKGAAFIVTLPPSALKR